MPFVCRCVFETHRRRDESYYICAMRQSAFFITMVVMGAILLAVLLVESYRECKEVGHDRCGRQWRMTEPQRTWTGF